MNTETVKNPCDSHEVWNNQDCAQAWSGARPMRVRDLKAMLNSGRFATTELDDTIVCFATEGSYVHISSVAAPCDGHPSTGACHDFSAVTLFSFGKNDDPYNTMDDVDWRDI